MDNGHIAKMKEEKEDLVNTLKKLYARENFNFPKFHDLEHVVDFIPLFGSPLNFNGLIFEHVNIFLCQRAQFFLFFFKKK
jgi:hypothetical protein